LESLPFICFSAWSSFYFLAFDKKKNAFFYGPLFHFVIYEKI